MSDHNVSIPESLLITLACRGDMGEGELPRLYQRWAEQECNRLGLGEKLRDERERRYQDLRQRAANILGVDAVGALEKKAVQMVKAIHLV